jgi:hypothetical protein
VNPDTKRNLVPTTSMPRHVETESKVRDWKQILRREMFEYFFNFAFLSFFLVSFAWYRRLILATYNIQYTGYWAPLIEAAVLAKVILIGDAMRIGHRLHKWPLAVPAIYRTVMFSVLVVLCSILEHVIGAWLHGKSASEGLGELTTTGWQGLLAWCVLINVAFLPFFTMKEVERAFGREKVRRMFFREYSEESKSPANRKDQVGS